MKKMKILFPLIMSLSLVFFYQNCGQTGGMTPFDDYYNAGSNDSQAVCSVKNSDGTCNDLSASITLAVGPQSPNSYNFSMQGSCHYESGFSMNKIHWQITSSYGYSANGYVQVYNPCNGYNYNTTFTVPAVSGTQFVNTNAHSLSIQLEGTSTSGEVYLSRLSNVYSVTGGTAYPASPELRQLVNAGSATPVGAYQAYNLLDSAIPNYSAPYPAVSISLKIKTSGDVATSLDPTGGTGVNLLEFYPNSTATNPIFTLGSSRYLGTGPAADYLSVGVNQTNVLNNINLAGYSPPKIWQPNTVYTVKLVIARYGSSGLYSYQFGIYNGSTLYASYSGTGAGAADLGYQPMRLRVGMSVNMSYYHSPTNWTINELKSQVCGYSGGTTTPETCSFLP